MGKRVGVRAQIQPVVSIVACATTRLRVKNPVFYAVKRHVVQWLHKIPASGAGSHAGREELGKREIGTPPMAALGEFEASKCWAWLDGRNWAVFEAWCS